MIRDSTVGRANRPHLAQASGVPLSSLSVSLNVTNVFPLDRADRCQTADDSGREAVAGCSIVTAGDRSVPSMTDGEPTNKRASQLHVFVCIMRKPAGRWLEKDEGTWGVHILWQMGRLPVFCPSDKMPTPTGDHVVIPHVQKGRRTSHEGRQRRAHHRKG